MALIAPSILSADFGNLAEQIGEVAPVSDWIHVDIMDAHFVPNLTIGPPVVASIRRHTPMFLDCHLMVENPLMLLPAFKKAGADLCSVHIEVPEAEEAIKRCKELGMRAGVALNPETDISKIEPVLEEVDLVLVMTVHPGFGGQEFMTECLPKIKKAKEMVKSRSLDVLVEVDGGINPRTAALCKEAGADVFVAGSFIFSHESPWQAVSELRQAVS